MTKYKLPEVLGGGELEEHPRGTPIAAEAPAGTVAFLIDGCLVCVAVGLLTRVKPPLPPEPGLGAVVLDRHDRAWQHVDAYRGDWCCTVDDLGADWVELTRDDGPLRTLVEAPEPVNLPWDHRDRDGCRIEVHESPRPWGACRVNTSRGVDLTPAMAREMARALNTAADNAEREATS
jgi:hypothetical protein